MDKMKKRYRQILQEALDKGIVSLPTVLDYDFEDIKDVYRAVKINDEKTEIDNSDFIPQAEIDLIRSRSDFDESNIENYGTSFFLDEEVLDIAVKLPRRNKKKAKGVIISEDGPTTKPDFKSHFMCFLYEDTILVDRFEVI